MPGASSKAAVTPARLAELNAGTVQAATLSEGLVIDHTVLLDAALPGATAALRAAATRAQRLGILKRMAAIGGALREHAGSEEVARFAVHPSDTVRGWACFALAARSELSAAALLEAALPLADDPHFTVREWVWMALRPRLREDLAGAVELLVPLTGANSPNVRRFASEALRPRGVWAAHLPEFKASPSLGLPLLEPLRADPSRYVQDSVGNWINDAAKDQPAWALELSERWARESQAPETAYILKRGLRSLR